MRDVEIVDRPDVAGSHMIAQPIVGRNEQHAVIDADPNAGGSRSFEQVLRFLGRDAHRLFDEHVDPGLQRFLGQGVMKVGGSQDVDDVDTAPG